MKPQLLKLVMQNQPFFWSIAKASLSDLDDDSIVEAILNYGDKTNIRTLFDILGTDYVASIFYKNTKLARVNYFPQVVNFFNLYFKRHVPQYSQQ